MIKTAPKLDVPILTSALTTLEAWNPRHAPREPMWNWALSRIRVVHTDDQVISSARELLQFAGLHGHKYAIDAVLAAVACHEAEQGAEVTIFTSDADDMERLLAGRPIRIEKV